MTAALKLDYASELPLRIIRPSTTDLHFVFLIQ